jgi:hypothetical protein
VKKRKKGDKIVRYEIEMGNEVKREKKEKNIILRGKSKES